MNHRTCCRNRQRHGVQNRDGRRHDASDLGSRDLDVERLTGVAGDEVGDGQLARAEQLKVAGNRLQGDRLNRLQVLEIRQIGR